MKKYFLIILVLIGALLVMNFSFKAKEVDYSSDVKPIFNSKCISCHGGVQAKGGFSLLFREDALAKTESGKPAIIPGDPANSEMIKRILSNDPEERMPYKHEALSKDEISILKRWIKQGAKWGDHWAYLPVEKLKVPENGESWAKNSIDHFIAEKLDKLEMKPSPQADRATLLRRVSLDLMGLYPNDTIAANYLKSGTDKAFEKLVDSLLASPR